MNWMRVEWTRADEALVRVRDYSCLSRYSMLSKSMVRHLVAMSFRSKLRMQVCKSFLHSPQTNEVLTTFHKRQKPRTLPRDSWFWIVVRLTAELESEGMKRVK